MFRLAVSLECEHRNESDSSIIFSKVDIFILEKFFFFLFVVYSWYFSSHVLMSERFSVIFLRDFVS